MACSLILRGVAAVMTLGLWHAIIMTRPVNLFLTVASGMFTLTTTGDRIRDDAQLAMDARLRCLGWLLRLLLLFVGRLGHITQWRTRLLSRCDDDDGSQEVRFYHSSYYYYSIFSFRLHTHTQWLGTLNHNLRLLQVFRPTPIRVRHL